MKFVFIAKHRAHLAGGMAMRCAGRVPVGLPCLAEPIAAAPDPEATKQSASEDEGELRLPATRPMAHGVSGATCWQKVSHVVCIGSSG